MKTIKVSPEIEDNIRAWRKVVDELGPLKPIASRAKKLETEDRELRKTMGKELGNGPSVFMVDGKSVFYSTSERQEGIDYEAAWKAAYAAMNPQARVKFATFLKSTTTIVYKFTSE